MVFLVMARVLWMSWEDLVLKDPSEKQSGVKISANSCADDITKYLFAKFVDDTKHHAHLNLCKIRKNWDNKNFLKINGYMQLHICFSTNGNVTTKVNLCSCDVCIEGKFFECIVKKRLYLTENFDVDSDKDIEVKISLRVRILKMNRMSFMRWDQILFLMWLRKMVW